MKIFPVKMLPISNKAAFGANKSNDNQNFSVINPITNNSVRPETENYKANFLSFSDISFEGVNKTKAHFELKTIEDMKCPCCGEIMMTPKRQRIFVKDVAGKKGQGLEEALMQVYEFYKPTEAEVVDRIISVSKQKPNLNLQEIVKQEAPKQRKSLEKKQRIVIEKMRNVAKGLKKESKNDVFILLDNALTNIKFSTDERHFKRGEIIAGLKEIEEKRGKEPTFKTLQKCAHDLPSTHTSPEAFFVKYARRPEREIAQRLVDPAIISTEHINPVCEDGEDNTGNYIPMCRTCNSKRSNIPYSEWLKTHPEMKQNLQEFINFIDGVIKEGNFANAGEYETYVDDIIKAFARETEGELILQRPDNIPVDLSEEDLKAGHRMTIEEKREKWYSEALQMYDKLSELKQLKDDLKDDDEYHRIVEYFYVLEKLNLMNQEKRNKSAVLTDEKRRLTNYRISYNKAVKDKEKEKKLEELKSRMDAQETVVSDAADKYEKASENVRKEKKKLDAIAAKLTFPEEIQDRINIITAQIDKMKELKTQIAMLEDGSVNKYQIEWDIKVYNSEIRERQAANDNKHDDIDFKNPENKAACKKYIKLKNQLNMINGVNSEDFKRLFKGAKEDPEFILISARQAVEKEIKALVDSNEAARWHYEEDAIQDLRDEVAKKELEYQEACDTYIHIQDLKTQYNSLKMKGTEETLNKKLQALKSRKADLDRKFAAVNIDKQIKETEQAADELMQKYTESFETEVQPQHSNVSDEPGVSQSS